MGRLRGGSRSRGKGPLIYRGREDRHALVESRTIGLLAELCACAYVCLLIWLAVSVSCPVYFSVILRHIFLCIFSRAHPVSFIPPILSLLLRHSSLQAKLKPAEAAAETRFVLSFARAALAKSVDAAAQVLYSVHTRYFRVHTRCVSAHGTNILRIPDS